MIPLNVSLSYYKRKDIQQEIAANSIDREIAIRFNDNFGKRPDTIRNAEDVFELAKQGATSFHASEELWSNPLALDSSLKKKDLDSLRLGWDLIIDIDCQVFEYSKIAAELVVSALKFHKVKSISCKFSGNKGFHIGVPFQAFPEKVQNLEISKLFPDAPKRIALYIKNMILPEFSSRIMEIEGNDIAKIMEKTGKQKSEIIKKENAREKLHADPILQMDTLLISSRHLYRMPYSLHEKSSLASIPFNPDKISFFKKELALPANVRISTHKFLDSSGTEKDEARQLFVQAFDFIVKEPIVASQNDQKERQFQGPQKALTEDFFPPCVKCMLEGMEDGKKRALFVLVNYFTSIGWDYDMIEKRLTDWNAKNSPPLREVLLIGQVRYHKQMKKKILPPNCPKRENNIPIPGQHNYYTELQVCKPDSLCAKIKNPVQYSTRKEWLHARQKPIKKRNTVSPN